MVLFEKETKGTITCLCWALNDNVLIMGSNDGIIYLWNMQNGDFLCDIQAYQDGVSCLTSRLSSNLSDICIISGGKDGSNDFTVKIWEQC
jgi:WD40 repeat protein